MPVYRKTKKKDHRNRETNQRFPKSSLIKTRSIILFPMFEFIDTTAIVSYCPKKTENVLFISIVCKDAIVNNREDRKSEMVLKYNEPKGVDMGWGQFWKAKAYRPAYY